MSDWPIVVGTAGHVDHGKTTLIRALTGVDTDRLIEEKRRGLTIDLGFAPFALPSGRIASVVDVPGHERFLKNMLAGVTGMDLVLLVVAADDGVMPQTREHLEILSLLHVRRGMVVLTKADLVDPDLLELARLEIGEALAGTFLEGAPILPVSAMTGMGLQELVFEIDRMACDLTPRSANTPFRLPIDRVFVKQGFGTIVTGTLFAGTLREGDAIEILPSSLASRVRGLQVHGGTRNQALAGMRVALNLAGIERADLGRGDWVLPPGAFHPSLVLDVTLELLAHALPLQHRTRIRLHHGTAEVIGRVHLLDRMELKPGEHALAQLSLEEAVVADFGDRFVLRLYSPLATIGGGTILNPRSQRARRHQKPVLEGLAAAAAGRWSEVASLRLLEAGSSGLTRSELEAQLPHFIRASAIDCLMTDGTATLRHDSLIHKAARGALEGKILEAIAQAHTASPWRVGVPRELLQTRTQMPLKALLPLLEELAASGDLKSTGRLWALASFEARPDAAQLEAKVEMRARLLRARFMSETDTMADLIPTPAVLRDLLEDLLESGTGVKLGQGMLASAEALAEAKAKLREHYGLVSQFSTSQARELLETNRKAIIPLLEYLDAQGFTKRHGEARVLLAPSA